MGVCENCAGEDEELTPVWPVDGEAAQQTELWCPECLERHPHEPADDGGEEEAEEVS